MLNLKPPDYRFCPFCSRKLEIKIEEGKERKYCSSCNWTYYPHVNTSVAAIIQKGKRALLVKRNREPYKDTWMFPAGFVSFGEHPEEALAREVKEETGLEIKKLQFYKILQSEDDPRVPGHFVIFYKVTVSGKIKNKDKQENKKTGWFNLKNPPIIEWKSHRDVFELI